MNNSTFIKTTLGLFAFLLITFAGFTFAVDPLYQYHQPWFGMALSVTSERYQNPGIAKNFDFDNVIMGDSLSQNFRSSWVDDAFGGTTVKLTSSGAYLSDYTIILDILMARKKQPDRIIWSMPINQYPLDKHRTPLALYLYDDNIINDVNYLLNKGIFVDFTCKTIIQNIKRNAESFDEAYVWDDRLPVGRSIALKAFGKRKSINTIKLDNSAYYELTTQYIERIRPYLLGMPNTHFYIWTPPFSMLYWDNHIRTGKAEAILAQQTLALEELLKFDNVSLYLFTDETWQDTISNLDNYKDAVHFSTDINRTILDCIVHDTYLVTQSNLKEKMEEFSAFVLHFDYDCLFDQ